MPWSAYLTLDRRISRLGRCGATASTDRVSAVGTAVVLPTWMVTRSIDPSAVTTSALLPTRKTYKAYVNRQSKRSGSVIGLRRLVEVVAISGSRCGSSGIHDGDEDDGDDREDNDALFLSHTMLRGTPGAQGGAPAGKASWVDESLVWPRTRPAYSYLYW